MGPVKNQITRRYFFESAHWLPKVPETHRCHRLHGHGYVLDVSLEGELDDSGFIIDFWELDAIMKPLLDRVDHRTLNDVEGLENPTAELIAQWFIQRICIDGVKVSEISVHETPDAIATVTRI